MWVWSLDHVPNEWALNREEREGMDALQYGRIFLRSHGDCFIHATDHWLKYWNASASRVSVHQLLSREYDHCMLYRNNHDATSLAKPSV